jgi:hypothetical protein
MTTYLNQASKNQGSGQVHAKERYMVEDGDHQFSV